MDNNVIVPGEAEKTAREGRVTAVKEPRRRRPEATVETDQAKSAKLRERVRQLLRR